MLQLLEWVLATSKKLCNSLDKDTHVWYNCNMNGIPQFKDDDEALFQKLVVEGLTLEAIRQQMPILVKFDDMPLIRKMLQILEEGDTDE